MSPDAENDAMKNVPGRRVHRPAADPRPKASNKLTFPMPKDEFDFEDPLELNGMAFLTVEDTTDAMCECFIEEFMRMGYSAKQILAPLSQSALSRHEHGPGKSGASRLFVSHRLEPSLAGGGTVNWPDLSQPQEALPVQAESAEAESAPQIRRSRCRADRSDGSGRSQDQPMNQLPRQHSSHS